MSFEDLRHCKAIDASVCGVCQVKSERLHQVTVGIGQRINQRCKRQIGQACGCLASGINQRVNVDIPVNSGDCHAASRIVLYGRLCPCRGDTQHPCVIQCQYTAHRNMGNSSIAIPEYRHQFFVENRPVIFVQML